MFQWYIVQKEKLLEKKFQLIIGLGIGVVLLVCTSFILFKNHKEKSEKQLNSYAQLEEVTSEETAEEEINKEDQLIFIDIKGEINQPGVYEMNEGDRLLDAIKEAGGLKEQADENQLNLAQKLNDEMVIYIPKVGEEPPAHLILTDSSGASINTPNSSGDTENEARQININTADIEELKQLSGIGDAKADNIIKYREENGNFKTIEDIKKVSGIGDRIFEQLEDKISVN